MASDDNELAKVSSIIAKLKGSITSEMSDSEIKALGKPSFHMSEARARKEKDKAGNSVLVYELSSLALSLGSIVKVGDFYLALSSIDKDGYEIDVYSSKAERIDSFRARKDVKECKLSDNMEVCIEIKEESELGFKCKLKIIVGYVGSGPGQ